MLWEAVEESRRFIWEKDGMPRGGMILSRLLLFSRTSGNWATGDWWEHVLEYSKSIRSVLDQPTQGKEENTSMLKAVWELIEVFYVDRSATWWLPERLVDWLAEYDKSPLE
ncbi:nuclear pore complex protein NUP85 [Selaginella moellendorffii]|uniref:nuclear pore complex protein NUP85 n=1 Tax=Selaginella moellendorffii TaxID=88036 RepID=UPI000D1CB26A|nr:nuclear pore complex protein NUP85 [Selaginella moellendorffii]|eukprot:XP_024523778.1 nuclear pore complex protein NUP85 [Selaginella moellendorffii]